MGSGQGKVESLQLRSYNCCAALPKETPDTKKDYLSKKTWDRIYNGQRLHLEGRHQEVVAVGRQIKKDAIGLIVRSA